MSLREARIDLGSISANTSAMRQRVGADHVMAVVKAQAYGHGAIQSARAAIDGGADWLGVVDLDEAFELRDAGLRHPVLTWLHAPDVNFTPAIEAGIDLGINSLDQLEQAAAAGTARAVANVHLKVDTGLGRNGIPAERAERVFSRAAELERLGRLRVRGLFSHLSGTSDADDADQAARFSKHLAAARSFGLDPELVHLHASAGALRMPLGECTMVRLGITIYGLSPLEGVTSAELGLRPAMRLSAEVVATKTVPAGHGVSYGYSYRTQQPTTLALVPLGYADGIPRAAGNRAPVSINGYRATISGMVAMDQFVVDMGDHPVRVGDRAVLFGDQNAGDPPVEEWAEACETINYEIVTRIGGRTRRSFVQ
ncbi:alanine racemase [Ruicaihuangia caeni]|uniref:Alanine racemase n=1 Tax=Ruicaihuangia caeni TaxID=3042517 RepID=A0AAW6T9A3_9MICO|nr:alanine racemase [Klugiella sp. YN-L-19]MDI2098618.1 alanine racemase [Klugiella sp. YN-L-19]